MPWPMRPAPISPTFFFVMASSYGSSLALLPVAAGNGDDGDDDEAGHDKADAGIGTKNIEHGVEKIGEKRRTPHAWDIGAPARHRCAANDHDGNRGEEEALAHIESGTTREAGQHDAAQAG